MHLTLEADYAVRIVDKLAIDNQFVKQATMKEAHQLLKLDKDSMVETIVSECTL